MARLLSSIVVILIAACGTEDELGMADSDARPQAPDAAPSSMVDAPVASADARPIVDAAAPASDAPPRTPDASSPPSTGTVTIGASAPTVLSSFTIRTFNGVRRIVDAETSGGNVYFSVELPSGFSSGTAVCETDVFAANHARVLLDLDGDLGTAPYASDFVGTCSVTVTSNSDSRVSFDLTGKLARLDDEDDTIVVSARVDARQ
jgi:hypothetical protein